MMRVSCAVLAVALAGSTAVAQAPRQRVAASAKWAVHVNVRHVVNSELFQGLQKLATEEEGPLAERLIRLRRLAVPVRNLLVKDVNSLTLYGTEPDWKSAVLVADLVYDREMLMTLMHMPEEPESTAHRGHTLLRHGKGLICFRDRRTILISPSSKQIKAALDVLDERAECLGQDDPLGRMLAPSKGSFVVAGARDLQEMTASIRKRLGDRRKGRIARRAALFKKIEAARIEIGEASGEAFAEFAARMVDTESAGKARRAAMGLIAMAGLMEEQLDPLQRELISGVKVRGKGSAVRIGVRYPAKDLLALLKEAAEDARGEDRAKDEASEDQPAKESSEAK